MNDAAMASRRAYKREWNKKNPDKVKEHVKRYWEKRALREQQSEASAR